MGGGLRILKLFIAVCVCAILTAPSVDAQNAAIAQILEKAGAYVDGFERQLTGIVAEETYVQQQVVNQPRELKSDLLLVPVAGEARYVEFRDVFAVDGRPVRDREDRLTRLFLDPTASARAQLAAIAAESARYNIGSIQRTFNIPTLALVFLRPENQRTVTFASTNRATPGLMRYGAANDFVTKAQSADFAAVPAGTRVISFKEAKRNTLIRGVANRDVPSEGRFWLDPTTGAVLMSELFVDDGTVTGVVDVRYRPTPSVGVQMLPAEMRESYMYNVGGRLGTIGRATYDHFRTFQVQTSTGDAKPVK